MDRFWKDSRRLRSMRSCLRIVRSRSFSPLDVEEPPLTRLVRGIGDSSSVASAAFRLRGVDMGADEVEIEACIGF